MNKQKIFMHQIIELLRKYYILLFYFHTESILNHILYYKIIVYTFIRETFSENSLYTNIYS